MTKRIIAFTLAFILLFSTFGAEFSAAGLLAYAKDAETSSENEKVTLTDDKNLVSVEGILPDATSLSVEKADLKSLPEFDGDITCAYDITILSNRKSGSVQPENGPVTVTLSDPAIAKAIANKKTLEVWHIADDGQATKIENFEITENGDIVFQTESFSVYVVIEHEGGELVTPRVVFHYINYDHTITYPGGVMTYSAEPYNFLDQGGDYLATQIVKNGEQLVEVPNPPAYNQQYFNGWYVVDMSADHSSFNTTSRRFTGAISYTIPNNPTRQTFYETLTITRGDEDANGVPITWTMNGETYTQYADAEGCAHIYLAPLYANFHYVNFFDFDGNLIARKLLVLDSNGFSSMLVSDLEATSPIDVNHYFMGWSTLAYQSGNANPQNASNTIPLYEDGYKQTVYVTLYGGSNYSTTGTLDIYYGDNFYTSVSELSNGTLKFNDFDTTATNGDVNFYAEYENAHWLRFIAGESGWGALYVPADYLVGDASATVLPVTQRSGYTFDGWYTGYQDNNGAIWYYQQVTDGTGTVLTNANKPLIAYADSSANTIQVENYQGTTDTIHYTQTGTVSSAGLQMTQDSYLFAKWSANNTATVKVIVWQQKVTDSASTVNKSYDYYNTYTVTATAATQYTLPSDSPHLDYDFTGFHLGSFDQNVWVDPQGTSVVNVYYDRDIHTYLFRIQGSGGTQYTFATDDTEPQFAYINGEYVQLNRQVAGTTTEYFLTQTNGGTTEYTGTIYDSNGNTVTNPVYGTTYYRTRNTNWIGQYTGVSNPLYWNSRQVSAYEWWVPVYVDEYYVDDTNGTFGNIGTDADPVYVPLTPVYNTTTVYYDAYVLTSTLTAGNDYLIINRNSAGQGYALMRNNTTASTDAVTVQTASGLTYVLATQPQQNSVWTVGSGFTFENGGYYLGRDTGQNGALSISTNPDYRNWSWNSGNNRLTIQNNRNSRTLRYNNGYVINGTTYSVYLYAFTQNALSETTQVVTGYTYDNNGTPTTYSGVHRYSVRQVQGTGSTLYTGTRFKIDSSSYQTVYVINELYGHNIADHFPITAAMSLNNVDYTNARWTPQNSTVWAQQPMVYVDTMTNEDVWFLYSDPGTRPTKTMLYYVTTLEGETPDYTYNGVGYTLYKTVPARYQFVTTEDLTPITGFTYLTSDNATFNSSGQTTSSNNNETFRFFYSRNSYTLTYVTNYPGDAQFTNNQRSSNSSISVPYQTELTVGQMNAPTLIAPEHYVFDGWYKDAAGREPFVWTETMPAANTAVYAKWYPVYYLIQIDPNGGTLAGYNNQEQSTYFWLQYGQTIGQYHVEREYVEATAEEAASLGNSGTYYYRYVSPTINPNGTVNEHSKWDPWPNVTLWESNLDSDKDAEGIRPAYYRMAEYIKVEDYHTANDTFYQHLLASGLTVAQANAWDANYVDTTVKYREPTALDPEWVFVGWYKDGEPYDFSSAVTANVTLTAVWRQAGNYFLYYYPSQQGLGVTATLTGPAWDPGDPSEPDASGYIDMATTNAATAPENIHATDNGTYVFEGWRVVDPNANPLDETGRQMSEAEFEANMTRYLFQPGDEITVRGAQAHLQNGHLVVELRAYYRKIEDSIRYPQVVQLVLDANDGQAGYIDPSAVTWPTWVNPGTSAVNSATELDSQNRPTQIVFGDAEINQAIHLTNYIDFFKQKYGDFLLGFDPQPDPELCEKGRYIPKYAADAVIAIDDPSATNILYAIWEPMVYVTFVNHTGAPVRISLDSMEGVSQIEATVVNNATQIYDRAMITAMDNVTVEEGQTIRLVLPKGMKPNTDPEEGRDLTLTIYNNHIGFKMSATKQIGSAAATELFGGTLVSPAALENGQSYQDTEELIRNYTGIIYTLTEVPLPQAYFDPNGGTWTDSSHTTNNTTTWDNAVKPNGQVFLSTTEQNVGRTQYKVKIEQFMQPTDPTAPSNTQFLGWTTDEAIGRFVRVNGDFSLTDAQLIALRNSATPGSDDYEMYDSLVALIESYEATYNLSVVDTDLLQVIEETSLWNFNSAPAGTTYYAVYAQTVTVNYHIMLAGGNNNHIWALSNSTTIGATCTGQAGTVYTLKRVAETGDSNRNHLVWYRTVVKGRKIIKPPAPTYYNNNSDYTFLYWLTDDSHTAGNTYPSDVTAYSFAERVTGDLDLYTSWTIAYHSTLRVVKVVKGPEADTSDTFNMQYSLITYEYSYEGGQMDRRVYATDSTGIVLQGTTEGNVPGTANVNYRDIPLYYWTSGNHLYVQALELTEEGLSASGYELTITDNDITYGYYDSTTGIGRTSRDTHDFVNPLAYVNNADGTNWYKFYPVSNHFVEAGGSNMTDLYFDYVGEKNGMPIGRFYRGSYNLWFWNNNWYTDARCRDEDLASSSDLPNFHMTATFTNTKYAKIRFVKTDRNGYDRLNGAVFTISKIDSSGNPTSQVLTFDTAYARTVRETTGRNGRFVIRAGTTIPESEPIELDIPYSGVMFKELGTYRVTEISPAPGYSLPSDLPSTDPLYGVNYVDIEVTTSGIVLAGGNTHFETTEPLAELNIGQFGRDNEYAVVFSNAPKTVYFKLQKVDTSGNPILTGIPDSENNPTSGLATFTASGSAAASGVWVNLGSFDTIITGSGAAAYTDVKAVPYGTYNVNEILAPVGYRTADTTRLSIEDDGLGHAVLIASGGNVYGTVTGTGTLADPFIVKIQDEELGYNLTILKSVSNEPTDGVTRVYTVTVTAQGETVAKVAGKTYNLVTEDASHNSTNTSVTFSSAGVATVTLKKDEKVTIRSIPRGSYVVSESTTATNESTGMADAAQFSTAIIVTEPATSHVLTTTTTNTTPAFSITNNTNAGIVNTFGHTLTITKSVAGLFGVISDEFGITVRSTSITQYTYSGSRSDDGGTTWTTMTFAATPASGSTPGTIEFMTRNNNPVNGGPIKHNTVIRINGIIDGSYTIQESIPEGSGYILTATVNDVNFTVTDYAFTFTLDSDDTAALTNTWYAVSPSGVTFRKAPYALMVILGLVLVGGLFLINRRKKEEE